jgi:hypothetical protein
VSSSSSSFESLPADILLEILHELKDTFAYRRPNFRAFDHSHRRSNVYNLMRTCKSLHEISLPCLYADVFLRDLDKSYSFFIALPDRGHLVRRLRIDEEGCREFLGSVLHHHIKAPDRLAAIARYCTNLREFFVGWDCRDSRKVEGYLFDGSDHWLSDFIKKRSTLESLILPERFCTDYTVKNFYLPLTNLTRLYVSRTNYFSLSHGLVEIAQCCSRLQEVYMNAVSYVSINDFVEFLTLVPALEVLSLQVPDFKSTIIHRLGKEDPHYIGLVLKTLATNNPRLNTLSLHNIRLPDVFPTIPPHSFPALRVLDMFDYHRGRSPRSPTIRNLLEFLKSLRALEVLHIDSTNLQLFDSEKLVCDAISPKVEVHTTAKLGKMEPAVKEAARAGRLTSHNEISFKRWAGIEDEFVRGWGW